ncbi:hypothetical protein Tco_0485730, partial [Tanacetum coccineum]
VITFAVFFVNLGVTKGVVGLRNGAVFLRECAVGLRNGTYVCDWLAVGAEGLTDVCD